MELLTVFWQPSSKKQIATELGDGVILIKDEKTGEPISIELLSYRPSDNRFDAVSYVCDSLIKIFNTITSFSTKQNSLRSGFRSTLQLCD